MKLEEILLAVARYGNRESVREPVSEQFSDAIQTAASNGQVERLKELLSISTDNRVNTHALQGAAENGHVECIRQLIPVSNPTDDDSLSLQWAAYNGHTECIRLLIPVSDLDVAKDSLKRADDTHGAIALIDAVVQMEAMSMKHLANHCAKPNRSHI